LCIMGTPAALTAAIDGQSARLTGDPKTEFDAVAPALKTLVQQHRGVDKIIELRAGGHSGGGRSYCNVELKESLCRLVEDLGPAATKADTAPAQAAPTKQEPPEPGNASS